MRISKSQARVLDQIDRGRDSVVWTDDDGWSTLGFFRFYPVTFYALLRKRLIKITGSDFGRPERNQYDLSIDGQVAIDAWRDRQRPVKEVI